MFNAKIYSSIYKHNNNKILINNYHSYQIQRKKIILCNAWATN